MSEQRGDVLIQEPEGKAPQTSPCGLLPGGPDNPVNRGKGGSGGIGDNNDKGKWESAEFLEWRRLFKNPFKKKSK